MKKVKFFAAMMAAATTLFAACNKETNLGADGSVPEGVPTYASISVQVNNLGTRATRAASQTGEKEIGKVQVLIFDKSGVLETVSKELTVDDSGVASETIATTTGQKTVYAVVNNNSFINGYSAGMTLGAFEALAFTAASANSGVKRVDVPVATAENFLMIGSQATTLQDLGEGTPNKVTLTVTRVAAKSQLLFQNVEASASFQPSNAALTFDAAASQLAQLQPTMNVKAPGASTGTVTPWVDPDYTETAANWIAAREKGFDQNNDSELTTVVEFSHYMPENINATPLMNTTTCMLVRVQATPTTWSDEGGTQQGTTFYALVKFTTDVTGDQKYDAIDSYYGIYKDMATAQAVLDSGALSTDPDKAKYGIVTYTDGYCYYRLNLRDMTKSTSAERYSVLRNNFYKVTVTEINNLGWNNPTDLVKPDDTRPVETQTSIEATITVADWTDVDMNEPLG